MLAVKTPLNGQVMPRSNRQQSVEHPLGPKVYCAEIEYGFNQGTEYNGFPAGNTPDENAVDYRGTESDIDSIG